MKIVFYYICVLLLTFIGSSVWKVEHNQREEIFVLKCALQGGKVENSIDKQVCLVHEAIKGEFK